MTPRGIFERLQGVWTFERTIQSASGDRMGSVQGIACFKSQTPNVLHYQEEGQWMALIDTNANPLKIHKEYLYGYQPESDSIEKRFSENGHDQGLFYPLIFEPSGLRAEGEHRCALDSYQATHRYICDDQNNLRRMDLEYRVNGPKKGYIARTVFLRS